MIVRILKIHPLLRRSLQTGIFASFFACAPIVSAEDWPTFRGAERSAVSGETGLLDSWPESGPQLLWTATGAGRGYASPAVADGRIYTLGDGPSTAGDDGEYLSCFSAENGKQLWISKTGPAWNEGRSAWQGSRSTPTVDGSRVYVVTPYGKLVCVNSGNGKLIWERDLKEQFGGQKKDGWGYSESPLVDGNKLICTPGGPKATVAALDKTTGETIWQCSRADDVGAGHSSAVISHVAGRKIYVQNTGGGPLGIDAETGEMLWDYDMNPPTAFIPTPVIHGDYVFTVAGYKLGGALLQQVAKPDGGVTIKEIYGPNTELANKHGGVILIDGKLYGGIEDSNALYCADLMTGEILWKSRGSGSKSISIVAADGKLFLRFENGTIALANVNPGEFKEISSFEAPGSGDSTQPSWAHPVISDGKLLIREGDSILCYDVEES